MADAFTITDHGDDTTVDVDTALAMLDRDGGKVHSFAVGSFGLLGLIGADWTEARAEEAIRAAGGAMLTGPTLSAMHHGVAVERNGALLALATKESTE